MGKKKTGKNNSEEAQGDLERWTLLVSSNSRNYYYYSSIVEIDFPIFFILFVVRGSKEPGQNGQDEENYF